MSDISAAAAELVERTTKAQGLPRHVEDAAALDRIAAIAAPRAAASGVEPEAATIVNAHVAATATGRRRAG